MAQISRRPLLGLAVSLSICGCLALMGCEHPPDQVIPNLPSIISSFKRAKDTSEDRASMVKGAPRIRIRFRRRGEELYRKARADHNDAIAYISASLTQGSVDQIELESKLAEADYSRAEFHEWYDGPARKEGVEACASCEVAVEALAAIADVTLKVIELQNEIAVQQRREFQEQLGKCEMKPWADLPTSR